MADWRDRLGEELYRKKVKVTRFSSELGFSREYVSRLLKPGSNPSLENLKKICDALEVSFVYIYTGKREDPVYDQVVSELTEMDTEDLIKLRDQLRAQKRAQSDE